MSSVMFRAGDDALVGQRRLQVTVGPSRCAYLVREGSADGFRSAVGQACTRWGGATEPILAVSAGGVLTADTLAILDCARVEGLVNVDVADDDAAVVSGLTGLPVCRLADVGRSVVGATLHPFQVGAPTRVGEFWLSVPFDSEAWTMSAVGTFTAEHLLFLDDPQLPVQFDASVRTVVQAQMGRDSWPDRTVRDFGETYGSNAVGSSQTVLWLFGPESSLLDCWQFWNVRALRPLRFGDRPMILAPVTVLEQWPDFAGAFLRLLRRPAELSPDVLLVRDEGLGDAADDLMTQLGLIASDDTRIRWSPTGRNRPEREAPFTYLAMPPSRSSTINDFNRVYGCSTFAEAHFYNGATTVNVASPVRLLGGRVLLRMQLEDFDALPKLPETANLCLPSADWDDGQLRIRTMGNSEYYLHFRVPTLNESLTSVLTTRTHRFALSDKGALGAGLASRQESGTLLEPGVYEVLNELRTPRSGSALKELKAILADESLTPDLQRFVERWAMSANRAYRPATQLTSDAGWSRVDVAEQLVRSGWAERGLQIVCSDCKLNSFIPLSDADSRGPNTCPGCRSIQQFVRTGQNLTTFYRLDSQADRAGDQGVLPHILAIAALTDRYPQSWFLPGVDVWLNDDTASPTYEVDLVGIANGEFVVGEVKTNPDEFTPEQLSRDFAMCTALQAERYLMATPGPVSSELRARAETAATEAGVQLEIMDKATLRPTRNNPA